MPNRPVHDWMTPGDFSSRHTYAPATKRARFRRGRILSPEGRYLLAGYGLFGFAVLMLFLADGGADMVRAAFQ